MNFFYLRKLENFGDLRVFDFGPYPEIENSENSEIPKFLKESKSFEIYVLKRFPSFPSFHFSIRAKIENSETSDIPQIKYIL